LQSSESDFLPDRVDAMLSPDGDREVCEGQSDLTVQRCTSGNSPVAGPELRLSDFAVGALAGLLRTASALEDQRLSSQSGLPEFSLPEASRPAPCQSDLHRAALCWPEVVDWASVVRIDRQRLPTADDATNVCANARMSMGPGLHWSPDLADRILFAPTGLEGAPEVEVGSAWFA